MKAYPKYKNSGLEFIGKIPDYWEMKKTKYLFQLIVDKAPKGNNLELLSLYTDIGVKPRKELEQRGNRSSTTDDYFIVKKKDIIVNKLLAWMGAIGVSDYDGVTSPAYDILRQQKPLNSSFYHHLFRCGIYLTEFKKRSRGIMEMRLRLYFDELGQILVPYPPPEEQEKLVSFLDQKTTKIDRLIEIKTKQIELLKEHRTAIINQAVTKGLNPDVKMKDSGVEWLGQIPEHWEVKPIGLVFDYISYGFTNPMPTSDEGPYMLTANDIADGKVKYETARKTEYSAYVNDLTDKSRPKKGDVLITKDGSLGRVAVAAGKEACINQSVAIVRVNQNYVSTDYIQNILRSEPYQEKMIFDAGGTTIKHIYITRLAKMRVAIPDNHEQQDICDFINLIRNRINKTIEATNTQINQLKEYRTALISEVVTGKIDVRNEV
jgi:type I restriction enzyme S subunit